jgi:hypothetical protein
MYVITYSAGHLVSVKDFSTIIINVTRQHGHAPGQTFMLFDYISAGIPAEYRLCYQAMQ